MWTDVRLIALVLGVELLLHGSDSLARFFELSENTNSLFQEFETGLRSVLVLGFGITI